MVVILGHCPAVGLVRIQKLKMGLRLQLSHGKHCHYLCDAFWLNGYEIAICKGLRLKHVDFCHVFSSVMFMDCLNVKLDKMS